MFRICRYLLVGLLILLWWRMRRQKSEQAGPARDEPVEIEVPPEAPAGFTPGAPPEADAETEPADALEPESAEPQAPEPPAPEPDTEAPKPEPDDLRRIEGIGPKIAGVLQGAGIDTFAQLAEMSAEEIRELLSAAGIRVARPDTWPEQANLAAEEDWDGLETLQGQLKGGQRV